MKTEDSNDDATGLVVFIMLVIITICCIKTCDNCIAKVEGGEEDDLEKKKQPEP